YLYELCVFFFFLKQKTTYERGALLGGWEMFKRARMRPYFVIAFRAHLGAVIYNTHTATEAGMTPPATPADLRTAPDTAGRPAEGTEIRILDQQFTEVPTGEVGTIYVRNDSQFDGYTSGAAKDFHAGFMSSGDVGY
ncbi:AMP-binding protein, partial [Pandoraea nosoerga]|nr:AMP-binding protein [Pandoraea nosoerga]